MHNFTELNLYPLNQYPGRGMCENEWQKNVRQWRDSFRKGLKFVTAARYRKLLRMRGYRGALLRDPVQYKIRDGRLLWW